MGMSLFKTVYSLLTFTTVTKFYLRGFSLLVFVCLFVCLFVCFFLDSVGSCSSRARVPSGDQVASLGDFL